jgi:hypothetical protein
MIYIKVFGGYSLVMVLVLAGIQSWAIAQQKQVLQEREGIYQKYEAIGISLR